MTYTPSCINHLRQNGSHLHKVSVSKHLRSVAALPYSVPPQPDHCVAEAFGDRNCPHLIHLLQYGDLIIKERVLNAMIDFFQVPQEAATCLNLGVLKLIENCLLNPNGKTDELASEVLCVLSTSTCGRSELKTSGIFFRILPLFTITTSPRICQNLYDVLLNVATSFHDTQVLTKSGYLKPVINHLTKRFSIEITLRSLQLLKYLVNDGLDATAQEALELRAIPLVAKYLRHIKQEISAAACNTLAALSYVQQGKQLAVEEGVIPILCRLLHIPDWEVHGASTGALMVLATLDTAKKAIIASNGLSNINSLLQSPKYIVQLNTLKLIAIIAPYPPARQALDIQSTKYRLELLINDEDKRLSTSATIAISVVTWKP